MASSHLAEDGTARMVDVGAKTVTARSASATGRIRLNAKAQQLIRQGSSKGSVIATATLAGIGAAKRTAELIPLCHNLPLDKVQVDFAEDCGRGELVCSATAATHARTGVEMEALAAVHVALLTVYDMCKSVDRAMVMTDIKLVSKSGGTKQVR